MVGGVEVLVGAVVVTVGLVVAVEVTVGLVVGDDVAVGEMLGDELALAEGLTDGVGLTEGVALAEGVGVGVGVGAGRSARAIWAVRTDPYCEDKACRSVASASWSMAIRNDAAVASSRDPGWSTTVVARVVRALFREVR